MYIKKIVFPILILCLYLAVLSWKNTPLSESQPESTTSVDSKKLLKGAIPSPSELVDEQIQITFHNSKLDSSGLSYEVFRKAYVGFLNLKTIGKVPSDATILSIADFNLSSRLKRLWIVDIAQNTLLMNTWVSHGRGSGGEIATKFSNINSSHQSSIGFYVTGEVYSGKHGRSLRLDGMDVGHNHKARDRAIVIHGADYVSAHTIKSLNRLGLSHGCPAVPTELSNQIIDIVKDKTVLYIHADVPSYHSKYLNEELAGKVLLASFLEASDDSSPYKNL